MPETTFKRETYLAKTSQVGAPMGNDGLFYRKYDQHSKKRARMMNTKDVPDSRLAKPKPFRALTKQAFSDADVEINVWDAQNPDRRGFKQGREYRGERPLKWQPSIRFNPAVVGGAASKRSGWFQGGTSQEFTGPHAHIERRYNNHESGAWMGDQNTDPSLKDAVAKGKKSINPFTIKIPNKLSIRHTRYQYA